ncbi:MAG: lipopolysaccharide biosynthesis protein [Candidatus Heimdallarchaeota archaeon]
MADCTVSGYYRTTEPMSNKVGCHLSQNNIVQDFLGQENCTHGPTYSSSVEKPDGACNHLSLQKNGSFYTSREVASIIQDGELPVSDNSSSRRNRLVGFLSMPDVNARLVAITSSSNFDPFVLLLNSFLLSGIGLLFWTFSAWLFSSAYVGEASALLGLMNLVALFAGFGFYISILRFIQNSKNSHSLISLMYAINAIAVSLLSLLLYFIFILQSHNSNQSFSLLEALGFSMFSVFTSLFVLGESILIGYQKFSKLILRNLLFNALRILFLLMDIRLFSLNSIFVAWGLASFISFLVVQFIFYPSVPLELSYDIFSGLDELKEITAYSFSNYLSSLFWNGSGFLYPVLIAILLTTRDAAYFSIPWVLVSFIYLIPSAITNAMVVKYSAQPNSDLKSLVLNATKLTSLLVLPSCFMFVLFGSQVLSIFGAEYSEFGFEILFLLAISAIPTSLNQIAMGIFQVKQQNSRIIAFRGIASLAALALIFILVPYFSLSAFSLGWLLGHSLVAIFSMFIIIKTILEDTGDF